MINTLEKFIYKTFGLHIVSEIPLPEMSPMSIQNEMIDVEIILEDFTKLWSDLAVPNKSFVIEENFVLFQVPNMATFSIQDGKKIIVSPMMGSVESEIRLFILGTCMGAILLQRKILPLHGSAIEIDGKAYGFIGDSGAGKSTLASAFINKGYNLLTDDVIAVSLTQEGIPVVAPSYPQQKLWQESLNEFGVTNHGFRPLFERENKYAIPVNNKFSSKEIPLAGIFGLIKTEDDEIKIQPIQGLDRLFTLFYHTYHNFMIAPSGLMDWHFTVTTKIASKINLYKISRPTTRFTGHDLPSIILETLYVECIK